MENGEAPRQLDHSCMRAHSGGASPGRQKIPFDLWGVSASSGTRSTARARSSERLSCSPGWFPRSSSRPVYHILPFS